MYQVIKTTDSPKILLLFICGYLLLGIVFLIIGVCIGHHYRKQKKKRPCYNTGKGYKS